MNIIEEYKERVSYNFMANPKWRLGQTYFNTLYDMNPDLANHIRGSNIDPFHNDSLIEDFESYVKDHW